MENKLLIGMLMSGENEYAASIDALDQQTFQNFEYFVIENLPNKLAHDTLYASFMNKATEFSYFLKLDADMVLASPTVLEEMMAYCTSHQLAHLMAYVHDCPSDIDIPGIQVFRSDTVWLGSEEKLNVDYPPRINGKSAMLTDRKWIEHMPDPGDYQLFRYGIHKALKAVQPDRENKNLYKGFLHLSILQGIARRARAGHSGSLLLSLIGAMLVLNGSYKDHEYHGDKALALYTKIMDKQSLLDNLKTHALEYWSNEIQSGYRWLKLVLK